MMSFQRSAVWLLPWLLVALSQSAASPVTSTRACDGVFRFASYYGSSMVLQRAPAQVTVWGFASAEGDPVHVTLSGYSTINTQAAIGASGSPEWSVILPAVASSTPAVAFTLTAFSPNDDCTLQLDDIIFGDVYVCSGQSNMEFQMSELDNPDPDIQDAPNYQDARIFLASHATSDVPLSDLAAINIPWSRPTTTNVAGFSALCWLFGRNVTTKFDIPVGLIQTTWGGTRIESWSSPDAIDACYTNRTEAGSDASIRWNAMINPFLPLPITGALWYQGESNRYEPDRYRCSLPAMFTDWRQKWNAASSGQTDPLFTFGNVQTFNITGFGISLQLAPNRPGDIQTGFTDIRWAQTDNQGFTPNNVLQNVYTAVAMDLPDFNSTSGSIHPRYKRQIAERLNYGAYQMVYGVLDAGPYQGPFPTTISVDTDISVTFDNNGANIEIRSTQGFEVCCSAAPDGLCPDSGVWILSNITSSTQSAVSFANPCADETPEVTGVRYSWRESPCELEACAVYRVENSLPVPPFVFNAPF